MEDKSIIRTLDIIIGVDLDLSKIKKEYPEITAQRTIGLRRIFDKFIEDGTIDPRENEALILAMNDFESFTLNRAGEAVVEKTKRAYNLL